MDDREEDRADDPEDAGDIIDCAARSCCITTPRPVVADFRDVADFCAAGFVAAADLAAAALDLAVFAFVFGGLALLALVGATGVSADVRSPVMAF
ncbi:MAG: hypothetical protein MEP57_02095 [Microvirga sp.]|nr:hypothetical protein [Microvirga sp.]